jgi:hypothetical protein
MEAQRKIQFGAGTVILNGLLAMAAIAPGTSLATSCTNQLICVGVCPSNQTAYCQSLQPGCTVTFTNCFPGVGACSPTFKWQSCRYNGT